MPKNVGTVDRIVRVVVGLAVAALGIVYHSWFGLIGAVLLLTAGFSLCPIYLALGLSTRRSTAVTEKK
ncbi:MAG TPA: DUF2892 domain-containing protein [Rectinemataceae bacterium]|nr:DUF2892 domain-containing protein [Rectinemataceae bacterium]